MIAEHLEIKTQRGSVEAVLRPPKPSKAMLIGLSLLVLVSFALPLSILFIEQLDIGFGYLLTIAIFLGTAIYFLRKLLWAFWGREVFTIEGNEVRHFFDYGLFRDGSRVLKSKLVKVGYAEMEKPDQVSFIAEENPAEDTSCYLVIVADSEIIRSHNPTTFGHVNKLSKMLQRND